ncbi:hypothetical protein PR202_ga20381 [Eleusine coracana subsp. coracana]|uniref:Uncharacterized protein n=1 Tax=Eleusine coracana subsp. coracana TaxID=191504 RepID=A0AAV5CYB3_ELECO|nr:hypothetical protein PR202_ga20381 [Eleusine coracana subsp. coracana]
MMVSSCQASRGMQSFKGQPLERGASNHFLGFLPRRTVPPSGPSRQQTPSSWRASCRRSRETKHLHRAPERSGCT